MFVDNLTVIDCAYFNSTRGILGESWIVDIALGGKLDNQGMMMDFSHVKKKIKQAIDDTIDHTLVVPTQCPDVSIVKRSKDECHIVFFSDIPEKTITVKAPEEAFTFIDTAKITLDVVKACVVKCIQDVAPDNVTKIECTVRTEDIDSAYYHYCHGLKKHDGNCQRIAHGHRSRIEIWKDGQRNSDIEETWADIFSDIYIGSEEDIIEHNDQHISFRYQSAQGEFFLSIPSKQCYIIPTDSTIEHIAAHICQQLKQSSPQSRFKVKAYEGVKKGAQATA